MNRDIKFRAWDGKYMYAVTKMLMGAHGGECFLVDGIRFDPVITERMNICDEGCKEKSPHCVLMQYTGLKDKNGKEIYEGDIVKDIDGSLSEIKFGLYEFGNCLGFYKRNKKGDTYANNWGMSWHWEVIGNIYENKELLE